MKLEYELAVTNPLFSRGLLILTNNSSITSSNTPSDIESSLATQLRTGMARSRRSIGGCRGKVHREDQQVLKLIIRLMET